MSELSFEPQQGQQAGHSAEAISRLESVGLLRAALIDLMPDAETLWSTQQPDVYSASGPTDERAPSPPPARGGLFGLRQRQLPPPPVIFRGHLAADSTQVYDLLRQRFAALGYTPLLRSQGGYDMIIALRHLFGSPTATLKDPRKWVPNVILLLLTLVTTTFMGAVLAQGELLLQNPRLLFQQPQLILTGLPSALTIMSILGIHELSHYLVARRNRIETTLPYFIPVPLGFGTFGAIIHSRTPWENRKALFDVGLAGPLAGLVVALPLFFLGLLMSPAHPHIPGSVALGSPLLLQWAERVVYSIRGLPQEYDIYANAMTFAAWFGVIVTGVNLLPVGQLDGGHVAYAVLGQWGRILGVAILIALVALGALVWSGWYVWAALIFMSGLQHPAPLNTLEPLGTKRVVVGALVLVLTILLFSPSPFPV
jgi:membrane-associated protease RseP (regulator of RpoE activity)